MKSQHLIELKAENFKRLRAVHITVDPEKPEGVLVLKGQNGAGKSSVLDAIESAICGERAAPEKPIRSGTSKAKVLVRTEDLVITKTNTSKGVTLTVKDADGVPQSSPQRLLDKLCTTIGFDPLAFSRMGAKEQAALLLQMFPVEIDLVENERAKTEAYERRRDLNRDARTVEAQLAAIPEFGPEVPDVEVSLSNLSKEVGTVREQKLAIEEQLHKVDRLRSNIEMRSTTIAEHKQKIEDLKTTIASLEAAQKADERLIDESANVGAEGDILDDQIQKLEQQIAGAEQLNKRIRAKQNRGKGVRKLNELKAKAEEEAVRIEDLERQRTEALTKVKYPIDGMSVTPEGVFIGDVPFSQASTAEQIRVGIALAAAANPALKLAFVRDGSLLDAKSMKSVAEIARLYGMQVLIERVDDNSPTAIEIVDGTTVGADDEAPDEESEPENVAATQQKRGRKPIAAAGITMEF